MESTIANSGPLAKNRIRANAYPPSAQRMSVATVVSTVMMMVFSIWRRKGT
ncbi:hypothetical protein D3C73_1655610 [compost metagenome]